MKKKKHSRTGKDRAELSGFLFAHFGQAVGIDIVPFLARNEDQQTANAMMKGRKRLQQEKTKKKK